MSELGDKGFRQSQAFLHTWSGLLLGWLLFAVFVTGTIAFYREGLNRWMRPELPPVTQPAQVLAGAQRYLAATAPDAKSWFITLPSTTTQGALVSWRPQPVEGETPRRGGRVTIDANGHPAMARETRGGEFFYRFHFDLYYMPALWARWLVGIAALFMLVAILSGVVTHKKIFRDFFALRRGRGQRSWLDGHNATAVLGLPFHLMITYTGLVTLMVTLLPWATLAAYSDDGEAYYDTLYPAGVQAERTGRPAPLVDLTAILRDAEGRLGGAAGYMEVIEPGDAGAKVRVLRSGATMLSSRTPRMTYDGATGKPVWIAPPQGAGSATAGAMIGVHAGRFANDWLRFIYFLCGVAGCVMVASGLVMWTVKRREKLPDPTRPHFGFRVVERLNVAAIGGLPLGIATMFWANRLLPVGMAGRAEWEIHCLFIAWGAASVLALVRRPQANWVALFALTGVLLLALPLYNLVATPAGVVATLGRGDGTLAGIDLALLVFGVAFLAIARRVARHRAVPSRVRRCIDTSSELAMEPAE
ncbi:PepSY domain-containing protein [Sphingomonas suaedae]|uniref:PepSY domain-containing protein n=1 Tax=Sphingomonas suaedae TaxID=2599297 RepID=A0A518RJ99_9SPHN|nr:PepSY-associated TM helix domain-containing protein [Sphingomonas suaedae]QDX27536.1 PepSY domain-containing protein [Sphingomonas suaedae]